MDAPVYSQSISYTYNSDGIRTSKVVNGVEHRYAMNGSQLLSEAWVQNDVEYRMHFIYDETGSPIAIQYRNSLMEAKVYLTYYLEKNLQGDVVAIYNEYGTKIGTYTYDAWGVCTATVVSGASTVEQTVVNTYNPFRYRGYYYDVETGLYYLQSRYYNPNWGRFISADGYVSTGQGLLGNNMFVYCGNNPVNRVDPTGEAWWHWAIAAAVVVACAAATVVTCGMSLSGAALAIGMVASGSAALTAASTVAATATIASGVALAGMATHAALNSDSLDDFAEQGNWGTIAATTISAVGGGLYGSIVGQGMDNPTLPTDKDRLNHIFSNEKGHIPNTVQNQQLLKKVSTPKNYVGTDKYGNFWYSKQLSDGSQAWSEVRNGVIWDGGINKTPLPWDPQTGYKRNR